MLTSVVRPEIALAFAVTPVLGSSTIEVRFVIAVPCDEIVFVFVVTLTSRAVIASEIAVVENLAISM